MMINKALVRPTSSVWELFPSIENFFCDFGVAYIKIGESEVREKLSQCFGDSYYGNQSFRSEKEMEWYQNAPDSQTKGVNYHTVVKLESTEDVQKAISLGADPSSIVWVS